MMEVTVQTIEDAAEKLKSVVKRTPLELSQRLSEQYQANIYFKREDLQEVRSFKIRGAYNKIVSLSEEEKARGVVCASAGNHAQGVSYSCAALHIQGTIFMPVTTPRQKVQKVQKFGDGYAKVVLIGEAYDDSYAEAEKFREEQKTIFVHPFNDEMVISGQGTVGKEIYDDLGGNVNYVFSSVGGGG